MSASSIVPPRAIFWRTPRSDFPSASSTIVTSPGGALPFVLA
jgi:hypothetical protein